jgi:uncharacterized membrane protein YphA (DoxX/SURF4 family)
MNIIKEFARYAVGGLFIFSGLIKVNDPVGTAIKLEEYFEVFAYDIAPFFEWFVPAALFLSVFLSVLEVVLGVALIIGYRMKFTAWVLLSIIVFFTFLTFYSAYFNKVTDCGCFGDAIKLTPWQSFYKDIILLAFIIIIFLKRDNYKSLSTPLFGLINVSSTAIIMLIIAILSITHLPFIDFRAYKIGGHIPTLMKASEPLRTEYTVEKDGKQYKFETYPTEPGYTFIKSRPLNPWAEPKITDLGIWNDDGEFTNDLLEGNKLLIIFHDAEKASLKKIDRLKNLTFQNPNFETWILTSSGAEIFEAFRHKHQLAAPYFFADATVLKTIVRSNPGVWLLKDGTVVEKWHYNDTPLSDDVVELLSK